jgi:hypothetical protein
MGMWHVSCHTASGARNIADRRVNALAPVLGCPAAAPQR